MDKISSLGNCITENLPGDFFKAAGDIDSQKELNLLMVARRACPVRYFHNKI
jgi:hypothetical protein